MTGTLESQVVEIPPGLPGFLGLPAAARGMVLFAHGSGSGRFSPRNNFVAKALRDAGLATLLFDLLTEAEAADRANVFDIDLLARRLLAATDWVLANPGMRELAIGYFGASTGAAAALVAAAERGDGVSAVVSRGGRPDLAGSALPSVRAPTLLIVGGADPQVLSLNRQALRQLHCTSRLDVVPDATHLFEEPGTMEKVVVLARDWFLAHLASPEAAHVVRR